MVSWPWPSLARPLSSSFPHPVLPGETPCSGPTSFPSLLLLLGVCGWSPRDELYPFGTTVLPGNCTKQLPVLPGSMLFHNSPMCSNRIMSVFTDRKTEVQRGSRTLRFYSQAREVLLGCKPRHCGFSLPPRCSFCASFADGEVEAPWS